MKTSFDTIFLGAGPAGTGPLLCALRRGDHDRLLARGVLWLDRGEHMVAGTIGDHDIPSDTAASVLLECLRDHAAGPLAALQDSPETQAVRDLGTGSLPLPVAGRFLRALGREVRRLVEASSASRFLGRTEATHVDRRDGVFFVSAVSSDGTRHAFQAARIVLAMGGHQDRQVLLDARIAGDLRLSDGFDSKTLTSAELVASAGQASLAQRLQGRANPRVAIIGGSHSAMTAAWLALNRSGAAFGESGVELFCRRLPKIFYDSRAEAADDGYAQWDERDVCPVTGRVFRLAGLRLNARELMRSVQGLGGSAPEKRLRIVRFDPLGEEAVVRASLDRADAIVAAFGYRPRLVPMASRGQPLALSAESGRAPLVDGRCRVLDADRRPLANLYGIGLASGFVPHGELGGEPSFDGQTNGLWLYQNGVGEIILDQLLAPPVEEVHATHAVAAVA